MCQLLYFSILVALRHLNDFENSHRAFEQAAILSPNEPVICLNYVISLEKKGELETAAEKLFQLKEIIESSTMDVVDKEV